MLDKNLVESHLRAELDASSIRNFEANRALRSLGEGWKGWVNRLFARQTILDLEQKVIETQAEVVLVQRIGQDIQRFQISSETIRQDPKG